MDGVLKRHLWWEVPLGEFLKIRVGLEGGFGLDDQLGSVGHNKVACNNLIHLDFNTDTVMLNKIVG